MAHHPLAYQRPVTIEIRSVGQRFGCVAVIRCAESGRELAETQTRPPDARVAAERDARELAAERNYAVKGVS